MAINFPNSPSIGQVYEFGDYRYTYDGVKWTSVLKYGLAAAKIASETPPPNPEAGLMWFVPSTGESYIWYEDEDSGQWIEERPSVGAPFGDFGVYGTVAQIAAGQFKVGQKVTVTDRANAVFEIVSGGELRKYMTEKEAEEWVIKTNKSAFESAAEASKEGIYGYEEFSKHGSCTGRDMFAAIGRTASRAFGVTKEKK